MTTTGSGYAKYRMTVTTRQPTQAVTKARATSSPNSSQMRQRFSRSTSNRVRRDAVFGLLFLLHIR